MLLPADRLKLSDRAQARIRSILAERAASDDAVRVFAERGTNGAIELGLAFDRRRNGDVEVPADGVTLVADPETLAIVRDRVIDYEAHGFSFAADGACESRSFTE